VTEKRQRTEGTTPDELARVTAVEREEARLVARIAREGPKVAAEDVEAARLLSTILAATLDWPDEVADETAVRLLQHWPWDVVRRAVDLAAQRAARSGPATGPTGDDVEDLARTLVEADRIATLRHRAREGDAEAAAELVRVKRALRIASRHD
jgi:Mn-dependent DtxR family transcriptional regulator